VSLLNGFDERRVATLIYVDTRVRRLDSGDRKVPDVPANSMSADGALCNMVRTALRSPSATAFRRGEAIVFVGNGVERKRAKTKTRKGGERRKLEQR
jgi:hypothetical protein